MPNEELRRAADQRELFFSDLPHAAREALLGEGFGVAPNRHCVPAPTAERLYSVCNRDRFRPLEEDARLVLANGVEVAAEPERRGRLGEGRRLDRRQAEVLVGGGDEAARVLVEPAQLVVGDRTGEVDVPAGNRG